MTDPSFIRFPVLAVLVGLVTALGSVGGSAVAQSGPDRPPELALIPGEAIGFVHVDPVVQAGPAGKGAEGPDPA